MHIFPSPIFNEFKYIYFMQFSIEKVLNIVFINVFFLRLDIDSTESREGYCYIA